MARSMSAASSLNAYIERDEHINKCCLQTLHQATMAGATFRFHWDGSRLRLCENTVEPSFQGSFTPWAAHKNTT